MFNGVFESIKRRFLAPRKGSDKRQKTDTHAPADQGSHAEPPSLIPMSSDPAPQHLPQPAGTSAAHMNGHANTEGIQGRPAQTSNMPPTANGQPPSTVTNTFLQQLRNPQLRPATYPLGVAGSFQESHTMQVTDKPAPLANAAMPAHAPPAMQPRALSRPMPAVPSQPTQQQHNAAAQPKARAWNHGPPQPDLHYEPQPAPLPSVQPSNPLAAQPPSRQAAQPGFRPTWAAPPSEVKPRQLDFQPYSRHGTPGPDAASTPMLGGGTQQQRQWQHRPHQQAAPTQHYPQANNFAQALNHTVHDIGGRRTDKNLQSYRERLAAEQEAEQERRRLAVQGLASRAAPQAPQQHGTPQPPQQRVLGRAEVAAGPGGVGAPAGASGDLIAGPSARVGGTGATAASAMFGSPLSPGRGGMDFASIDADQEKAVAADQQLKVLQAQMAQMMNSMKAKLPPAPQPGHALGSTGAQGRTAPLTVQEKLAQLKETKQQNEREVADVRAMNELRIRDIQAPKPVQAAKPVPQPQLVAEEDDEVIILSDDEEEHEVTIAHDDQEEEYEEEGEEYEEGEEEEEEPEEEEVEAVPVPRNSPEELASWQDLMTRPGPPSTLVVEHARSSLPLTLHSLRTLKDGTWLNDEIINVSMALMQERDWNLSQRPGGRPAGTPKVHYFSSFFLNKLHKDAGVYSYKEVSRWTKTAKIKKYGQACSTVLDCDMLIFPVHVGQSHWATACIHLKERRLKYWDSMATGYTPVLDFLAQWVVHEAEDKLGRGTPAALSWADALDWPRDMPKSVPQQHNGCDCGIFAIMFAAFGGAGKAFDFKQRDMPVVRRRLMHDLSNLKWTIA